jgi:hypothetical protein
MTCNLNLQRNTKVFFSTINLADGDAVATMTPQNTWQVEVLAGYAASQASATQDITTLESGTTPDRGSARFNTAIEPANWNFTTYIRPTGLESVAGQTGAGVTNNSKPVADWFLWQALMSSSNAASGASERSAWQTGGQYDTATRATSSNVAAHNSNFGSANEYHLYVKMDNVVYQIKHAAVNQAAVDAAIDSIATTTWTGFGRDMKELTGTPRNNAIAVFGGTYNDGSTVTANSSSANLAATSSYHPWGTYNVSGTSSTASFIKNRLSSISLTHTTQAPATTTYTFPVTALTWTWNNNITYLTPEELASLNTPIGNFAGARQINGSVTAYLRHGSTNSATFRKNIVEDTRTSHATAANANVQVGGTSAPYIAFYMPAVQFSFPVHNIEDVISLTIDYVAQEPSTSCGNGGEVILYAKK